MKNITLILISFVIFSCTTTQQVVKEHPKTDSELAFAIQHIFADTAFTNAHWGVTIKSLKTGKVLYAQNEEKLFNPASNTKIATAAAALLELGPDFRFETILYTDGIIQDSVLKGNLYVKGDGDPTLYERFFAQTTDVFVEWSQVLKSKGIKHIQGSIIADITAFDEERIGFGWPLNGLDAWYSAEISPLQLNENYIDLTIIPPSTPYDTIQFIPNVNSSYFNIINQTTLIDTSYTSIQVSRAYGKNDILVQGLVKIGGNKTIRSPAITHPELFYITVLKETLEQQGILTDGSLYTLSDTLAAQEIASQITTLHTHYSASGIEILKELMKRSQNLYAETMPRKMALNRFSQASFSKGAEIVAEQLEVMGIKKDSYQYMDGSGLTRYNYFSPNQFSRIMEYMYQSPYRFQWLETLPIAGVDGTLKNRMKGTRAQSNVRAKTGTISNVRGLSGYVHSRNGEVYVFSFLVNGHLKSTSETDRITDSVLKLIADY